METHYWPHQNTQGVTKVSDTSGSFLLLANARGAQSGASTKHLTPTLCSSCQLSCWFKWQRSLLLTSQLLLGMRSWNHAQHNLCPGGSWIPEFWPQKMTSGCVLKVPGLQSQGSLAAVPCDTLIEPLITWSHGIFPLQNSCVFQRLGWLVLF